MIATSNFVNQVHNGTVNNNNNNTTLSSAENIGNDDTNSTMSTNVATENYATTVMDSGHENCQMEVASTTTNAVDEMVDSGNNGLSPTTNNNDDDETQPTEEDSVDITISNVVTNFSVCCHLNLRQIATTGSNVVYRRDQSIIIMKLRQPFVTASIWSSGKITCTGSTTEESAKSASRKVARCIQKLGYRAKFSGYRVVNVLGACKLPFGIKIHEFSAAHRPLASYEPELHPGATYRISELKAVLKIFQTGSITITAPNVRNVQLAVEHIYPLVYEFRKPKQKVLEKSSSSNICSLNYIDEDEKDALEIIDTNEEEVLDIDD